MSKFNALVAATLIAASLTGCAGGLPTNATLKLKPMANGATKAVLKPAPVKSQALAKAPTVSVLKGAAPADVQTEEAAAATVDAELDQTLEALDLAEGSGYQLQGILANLGEKVKAVLHRRAVRQGVVKAKGAIREDLKAAFKKVKWVDNGDGTKSKSIKLDTTATIDGVARARHLEGTITRDAETNVLVKAEGSLDQQLASGATLVATSSRTLQDDGGYLVVRHSLATLKGGKTRTADHTRTIGTDGMLAGEGTVTWKNAAGTVLATRTWTFAGNEDEAATEEMPAEETGGEEVVDGAEG